MTPATFANCGPVGAALLPVLSTACPLVAVVTPTLLTVSALPESTGLPVPPACTVKPLGALTDTRHPAKVVVVSETYSVSAPAPDWATAAPEVADTFVRTPTPTNAVRNPTIIGTVTVRGVLTP